MKPLSPTGGFIYTYAYHQDEKDLCQLEMRAFFGEDTGEKVIKSSRAIAPGRSPFIKERIELLFEEAEFADIVKRAGGLDMVDSTFKVIFPKINGLDAAEQVDFDEKRDMERQIGFVIKGKADVHNPDIIFGLIPYDGRWHFGIYQLSESVWFKHQQKPREYSTALSTKTARAIANIAVPDPKGVKAIDPCCGIGTVLVEALSMGIDIVGRDINPLVVDKALSMGIDIVGRDINPLVVDGSRENIVHFGLSGSVDLGAIADITEQYDVAIIDMPYNLYTHATPDEQQEILKHALPVTEKLLVVTIEPIDHMIEQAGFTITDRCIAKKSLFLREILVCEKTGMPPYAGKKFQQA
ncbi:RNA methyltransferase [Planococcus sp. A6]|uniref:TRM11 family SAM-dependent methyltransferase n=1 Tax=Planococcus sp. A6 TaxID=2992760 RepID=UPI00237A606B|nr:RNA methyltransferase [Planococcus sp. A6]MDE0582354.1 RNA methyltransferase [Planococcus sp. A6]